MGHPHNLHSPWDVARRAGHFRVGENSKFQNAVGLNVTSVVLEALYYLGWEAGLV